eukprot:8295655-Pyramimonas_sp.AAC.1
MSTVLLAVVRGAGSSAPIFSSWKVAEFWNSNQGDGELGSTAARELQTCTGEVTQDSLVHPQPRQTPARSTHSYSRRPGLMLTVMRQ